MAATILTTTQAKTPAVDLDPKSAYEVITREKVDHIDDELKEIRYRVNGIFYLVIGSVLLDWIPKWLG